MGLLDVPVDLHDLETFGTDGSAKSGLVARPWSLQGMSTVGSGTGTAANVYNSDATRYKGDDDSSLSRSVRLITPAGLVPACVGIYDTIYGSNIAPRWYGDYNGGINAFPFDYEIDGEIFAVDDVLPKRNNLPIAAISVGNQVLKTPFWIDSGRHSAGLHLVADPAVARSMYFTGWTVAGSGYTPAARPAVGGFTAAIALTTTAQTVPGAGLIKNLHFCNTDTVAHVVTVTDPNSVVYAALNLAANGGTGDVPFEVLTTFSGWKAKIEATPGSGAVNCWSKTQ